MTEDLRYRVVCCDPPWRFSDKLPGSSRGAARHYATMSTQEICTYLDDTDIDCDIADEALLFMWRVSGMVEDAYEVVRAWGFEPKSEIVWQKLTRTGKKHFGMGRYVRASHETCIVARRGRPKLLSKSIRSTFEAPTGRHSAKPEFFYTGIVERLSAGPYLELFGRTHRQGWTVIGNQLPKEAA